jgi:hypothetical protein
LLEERLRDAAAFCGRLRAEAEPLTAVLDPVAASLERLAGVLAANQEENG